MVTRLVKTEALIPAPPEKVWVVLSDFNRYAEWNPLNTAAKGEGRLGAKISMTIFNPLQPDKPLKMPMRITAFEPGKYLEWVGSVPFIFRGEHSFRLSPEGGGTRLVHCEELSGLMARNQITDQVVAEKFVPAYEACNRALREPVAGA